MIRYFRNIFTKRPTQQTGRREYKAPVPPEVLCSRARHVVDTLTEAGHEAYLVGGCIRDLLLDEHPKDFDVATSARPAEVRALFRRARIIGRRFQIVHVMFGRTIIEVTTFRGSNDDAVRKDVHHKVAESGRLLRDNVWGSLEDDALRRDFTVNALYLDVARHSIIDFVDGIEDLAHRRLRLIGDPDTRYREDPVRMLRAVRFAARLDFDLEGDTGHCIQPCAHLLRDVPPARLFDEVLKLFLGKAAVRTLDLLLAHRLLEPLFPETTRSLDDPMMQAFVRQALEDTDQRLQAHLKVSPAFLYAALLWPAFRRHEGRLLADGIAPFPACQQATQTTLQTESASVAIPKRFQEGIRDIWELQLRLLRPQGKRAWQTAGHPRFRAAYDFLLLREKTGEDCRAMGSWWTEWQQLDQIGQESLLNGQKGDTAGPARKRRRRRRPRQASSGNDQP
jgi:poly(A) polymerase